MIRIPILIGMFSLISISTGHCLSSKDAKQLKKLSGMAETPYEKAKQRIRSSDTMVAYCLLRVVEDPKDEKAAKYLSGLTYEQIIKSAKATYWKTSLPMLPESHAEKQEMLCVSFDGVVANYVLYLRTNSKGLEHVIVIKERQYCFYGQNKFVGEWSGLDVAFILNRGRVVGTVYSGSVMLFKAISSKGLTAVPKGYKYPKLDLKFKNFHHWTQNAFGTPKWAKRFIHPSFAKSFKPTSKNMDGEINPKVISVPPGWPRAKK